MRPRISAEVTNRQTSHRFLLSALTKQGERVAARMRSLSQPHLEDGDAEPGFSASVVALTRRLTSSFEQLRTADLGLFQGKALLTEQRARRDELARALGREVVRVRRVVLGLFLKPDLESLALSSPRLYRPDPLLHQVDMIAAAFARDDVDSLLGTGLDGATTAVPTVLKRLDETAQELRRVLVAIDDGRRDVDEAMIGKQERKNEYDEVFTYTARTFEAYCRLAGLKDLAERVRTSSRRPGRVAEEPEPEPEPDAEINDPDDGGQIEAQPATAHPDQVFARTQPGIRASAPRGGYNTHDRAPTPLIRSPA